ncbi:unnamed protein product [Cylicostephanus goldi]|uniref:Uncharacterized protein n=1 Tax=Cylicostephanus goldi TaxID=71465 RepID=A0A3P7NGJ3_CYLGO|nr:unnamed protein product [Cylicostephanus goldi]
MLKIITKQQGNTGIITGNHPLLTIDLSGTTYIFDTKIDGYDDVDENGRYRRRGVELNRAKTKAEQVYQNLS